MISSYYNSGQNQTPDEEDDQRLGSTSASQGAPTPQVAADPYTPPKTETQTTAPTIAPQQQQTSDTAGAVPQTFAQLQSAGYARPPAPSMPVPLATLTGQTLPSSPASTPAPTPAPSQPLANLISAPDQTLSAPTVGPTTMDVNPADPTLAANQSTTAPLTTPKLMTAADLDPTTLQQLKNEGADKGYDAVQEYLDYQNHNLAGAANTSAQQALSSYQPQSAADWLALHTGPGAPRYSLATGGTTVDEFVNDYKPGGPGSTPALDAAWQQAKAAQDARAQYALTHGGYDGGPPTDQGGSVSSALQTLLNQARVASDQLSAPGSRAQTDAQNVLSGITTPAPQGIQYGPTGQLVSISQKGIANPDGTLSPTPANFNPNPSGGPFSTIQNGQTITDPTAAMQAFTNPTKSPSDNIPDNSLPLAGQTAALTGQTGNAGSGETTSASNGPTYDLLGALTQGAQGQGAGSQVQNATQTAALNLLNNPSPYGQQDVKDLYSWLGGNIDDQYNLERKQLGEEMAKRGLGASTIYGGNLNDLNIGQRSAQETLAENLAQNYAQSLGQYEQGAINSGNTVGNAAQANNQSWLSQLMGYGQNAFSNDLATNMVNQNASNQYQNYILSLLGLGYSPTG